MKLIKAPSPMRLLCGSALAYWLSNIINPAFVAIAVMIVLFIPLFITDYFFDQSDMKQPSNQSEHPNQQSIDSPTSKTLMIENKQSSTKMLMNDPVLMDEDGK